jgi:erythromycin esterase-like protein
MSQDIRDFLRPRTELLALGEPVHSEPAFQHVRNAVFRQLAGLGFRSIVLETDRVAALQINDYIQDGTGDPAAFSHDFGDLAGNQELVAWMRDHNRDRPPADRLTFHGFDAPTENYTAPSPRRYFEYARPGLDLSFAGDEESWGVMTPADSMGASPEAERLRTIGEELLAALGPDDSRARIHVTAGLGLLRYHAAAARPLDFGPRMALLLATRDALMAQNLLEIRTAEAGRGPTLVHSHNAHLRLTPGGYLGAGAIVGALLGDRYQFIAGSLGHSDALGLDEPEPDTYEGSAQPVVDGWGLVAGVSGRERTGGPHGYFPLDAGTLDGAEAVLHIA